MLANMFRGYCSSLVTLGLVSSLLVFVEILFSNRINLLETYHLVRCLGRWLDPGVVYEFEMYLINGLIILLEVSPTLPSSRSLKGPIRCSELLCYSFCCYLAFWRIGRSDAASVVGIAHGSKRNGAPGCVLAALAAVKRDGVVCPHRPVPVSGL